MKKLVGTIATAAVVGTASYQAAKEREYVVWSPSQMHATKVTQSWLESKAHAMRTDDVVEPVLYYHTMMACQPAPPTGQVPCCQPCNPTQPPDNPGEPPDQGEQKPDWGVVKLKALEAQKINDGSSVVVGIADTGVDIRHPDLKIKAGANFTVGSQSDFHDGAGHGTHVSGLVSAVNNKIGVVGSSQAQIIMAKVLDDQGSGTNESIANGFVWLCRQGIKVLSASLGGPQASQAIGQAVQFCQQQGVVVVAAAGNDGGNRPNYPAGYQGVIAISAMDESGGKAHFSSWGNHIAMTCPGTNIMSTCVGGKYCNMQGTSMATPLCAGVIALSIASGKPLKYQAMGNPQWFGKGLPNALATVNN